MNQATEEDVPEKNINPSKTSVEVGSGSDSAQDVRTKGVGGEEALVQAPPPRSPTDSDVVAKGEGAEEKASANGLADSATGSGTPQQAAAKVVPPVLGDSGSSHVKVPPVVVPAKAETEPEIGTVRILPMVPDKEDGDVKKPGAAKQKNYASRDSGAVLLEHSPSTKGADNLLVDSKDKYAISPCEDKQWVVIGLSEDILVRTIVLGSHEKYSRTVKEFQVLASLSFPVDHWMDMGTFTAQQVLGEQSFNVPVPAYARYLKFKFSNHHGDEYYCTLSHVRVYGSTMLETFHKDWQTSSEELDHRKELMQTKTVNVSITAAAHVPSVEPKANDVSSTEEKIKLPPTDKTPEVPVSDESNGKSVEPCATPPCTPAAGGSVQQDSHSDVPIDAPIEVADVDIDNLPKPVTDEGALAASSPKDSSSIGETGNIAGEAVASPTILDSTAVESATLNQESQVDGNTDSRQSEVAAAGDVSGKDAAEGEAVKLAAAAADGKALAEETVEASTPSAIDKTQAISQADSESNGDVSTGSEAQEPDTPAPNGKETGDVSSGSSQPHLTSPEVPLAVKNTEAETGGRADVEISHDGEVASLVSAVPTAVESSSKSSVETPPTSTQEAEAGPSSSTLSGTEGEGSPKESPIVNEIPAVASKTEDASLSTVEHVCASFPTFEEFRDAKLAMSPSKEHHLAVGGQYESIFKTLMNKIMALEIDQSLFGQYMDDLHACYRVAAQEQMTVTSALRTDTNRLNSKVSDLTAAVEKLLERDASEKKGEVASAQSSQVPIGISIGSLPLASGTAEGLRSLWEDEGMFSTYVTCAVFLIALRILCSVFGMCWWPRKHRSH